MPVVNKMIEVVRRVLLFLTVCVVAAPGCTSESGLSTVAGRVTLDGQPLETGIIRFVPIDGQTATADATVTDGKFAAQVPPGEKRIEITAPNVGGEKRMYDTPDSPSVEIVEELLPARYNVESELTLTVAIGGSRGLDLPYGSGVTLSA